MQWLNDKKNLPYVIGGAFLIVLVVVLMIVRPWGRGGADQTAVAPGMGAPGGAPMGAPPTMPGGPGMGAPGMGGAPMGGAPGADSAAPAPAPAAADAKAKPMEPWRDDPFLPAGVKSVKRVVFKPVPRILDFPFPEAYTWTNQTNVAEPAPKIQPTRRMAGILLNSRIFAIIETNGKAEVVQPGDMLNDRLAVVDRIERDRVFLKTTDKKPRQIVLRLASAPKEERRSTPGGYDGGSDGAPGGSPMMPGGLPGMPGMPGAPPPPPM